ncbi:MAG: Gfo/Idh/MocA family oxidoreductase [Candidatus Binatia bacterium]
MNQHPMLPIRPESSIASRDTVLIIGCGDVTQNRAHPALGQLREEGCLHAAAYVDINPIRPPYLEHDARYFQIDNGCLLPLNELARNGLLGPHVVAVICTPTPYHALYATQLLGTRCYTAVEKPLTQSIAAAEALLPFTDVVFPIGHQLFKADMLEFLDRCQQEPAVTANLTALSFDLWESKGVGNRSIDDAVWDLGWHGFECILAPLRAAGHTVAWAISRVQVVTYDPLVGEPSPTTFTATVIDGWVRYARRDVPFRIRVGKGLPEEHKQLAFHYRRGINPCNVSLQESGWQAHYRVLRELLTAPKPNLKLSLADTVAVVELCTRAGRMIEDTGTYAFGTLPDFLYVDMPREVWHNQAA